MKQAVQWRRQLHSHPEAPGEGTWTTNFLGEQLRLLGANPRIWPGGVGLHCDVGGTPEVIFESPLNGARVADDTARSYSSRFPGLSHAFGNDVSCSAMLEVVRRISEHEPPQRAIRVIFNDRSVNPRDVSIRSTAVRKAPLYAFRCDPFHDVGTFGIANHLAVPGSIEFEIYPDRRSSLYAIEEISSIIVSLPLAVQRAFSDTANVAFAINHVNVESPLKDDSPACSGTFQFESVDSLSDIRHRFELSLENVLQINGSKWHLKVVRASPAVANEPTSARIARSGLTASFGEWNVFEAVPDLLDETFGELEEFDRKTLIKYGSRHRESQSDLGSGQFDVDERAIDNCASAMLVLATLNSRMGELANRNQPTTEACTSQPGQ